MRAFAARDPVVTTGTGTIEAGQMLAGFCAAAAGRSQTQHQLGQRARLTRSARLQRAGRRD
jgi:hypothetical protein